MDVPLMKITSFISKWLLGRRFCKFYTILPIIWHPWEPWIRLRMEVQIYFRIWKCGKNLSQMSQCATVWTFFDRLDTRYISYINITTNVCVHWTWASHSTLNSSITLLLLIWAPHFFLFLLKNVNYKTWEYIPRCT